MTTRAGGTRVDAGVERARVRLVALDLDGTLLTRGGSVSAADAAAVRAAVARGVQIVFATSRWYAMAKPVADDLGVTAPIICHNGAQVRDAATGERLLDLRVPAEAARDVAEVAERHGYDGMATVHDVTWLVSRVPDIDPARLPAGMVQTARLADHVADGCEAFLFFGQDAVDGVPAALGARYAGVLNFASGYSSTFPAYLNIVHAAADKGRALALVAERLHVPLAETMAIGDAAPDLEMMRVAGVSMAMGNAPDDVKAQAAVVGPGNHEGGVAWALERFAR